MKTVDAIFSVNYEEKKSNFLCFLTPFKDFESLLLDLKAKHPKARHFVTASRHLNAQKQIVESFSDDGEPKGTSGKPTLHVLQGNELINIGMITVRYFGGIKLGTGGLVRAYSDSANATVAQAKLMTYLEIKQKTFSISYPNISRFEYDVNDLNLKVFSKDFDEHGGKFIVEGTRSGLDELGKRV